MEPQTRPSRSNPSPSVQPTPTRLVGSRAVLVYILIAIIAAPLLLSIGSGGPMLDRIVASLYITLDSAWIPIVYLLGLLGLGRMARRWTWDLNSRWIVELGIGFSLMLSLSHGLGVLGWLNTTSAWITVGFGCLLLLVDFKHYSRSINHSQGRTTLTIPGVLFVVGCVLVILLATNPPGALWDSEFGAYDSLSYHLELPREWLEAGRIEPVTHNVYSYLPGYFEAAYLHFAHLANAPKTTPTGLSGFLADDGRVAMSTQLFSAILIIISSIAMRKLVDRFIEISLPSLQHTSRSPGLCARALLSSTPWIVVVGTLAYNEIGVVLLSICAIAVVIERDTSPNFRAIASALIVAGACSIKPTALFLIAPSIAVLFLSTLPPKAYMQWLKPIILGSLVGLLMLSPWLIRNQLAASNPVFPQLASLFGNGAWTTSQHDLYSSAHHFDGSMIDRLKLLILPDPTGTQHVSRFRGLTNLQWGIIPALGFVGCAILIIKPTTRRTGIRLSIAVLLPMIAWLMLTHLQSRFLIPMIPFFIIPPCLALASLNTQSIQRTITNTIALIGMVWLLVFVSTQSAGNPFALIDLGTRIFSDHTQIQDAPWSATLNTILDENETVYLLGDANPFYIRSPIRYNTVYDHWLIEDAIKLNPQSPQLWSQSLIDQGVDVVVISFSELARFSQSGWLPESIDPTSLNEWINTLSEPIYVWSTPASPNPIRAAFRLHP